MNLIARFVIDEKRTAICPLKLTTTPRCNYILVHTLFIANYDDRAIALILT